MTRRNTITAILFLALTAAGLALLASSFFGGNGSLENLLKSTLRTRDVGPFWPGRRRRSTRTWTGTTGSSSSTAGYSGFPAGG